MKKLPFNNFKLLWLLIPLLAVSVLISGCGDDDDDPPVTGDDPIASFQFTIDQTNFLQVTFSNFSQNATSYDWDFGDGNSSAEKDPVHTYAAGGVYTVVLTAFNDAGTSAQRSETITITDPNSQLTLLAGETSKTWYMNRETVALGIGPAIDNNEWWSFGGVTPLGDRPCILDDQYIFHRDGTFEFNSNGTVYVDAVGDGGWLVNGEDSPGCYDDTDSATWGDNPERSAFGSGNYTYVLDNSANTLTISGLGAYIGLPNKTEAGDNPNPIDTKTYTIFNFTEGDIADTLSVALNGPTWNFYLVSYHNPADLPDIPGSLPRAAFSVVKDGFTVTCSNSSANATSYTWDFGDGGMSTEENPEYTYASEGTYTITLTAMDDMGNSDMVSEEVVISAAQFTAAALSDADGKTWVLNGPNAYYVGPNGPGDNGWWPGPSQEEVDGARACHFDDEFIFSDDGVMVYDSKGQVYAEAYMGGQDNPGICINDEDLVAPFDVYGSGTHMFSVTEATDTDPAKITVMGDGAFIGFNKAYNGVELPADGSGTPATEITYDVIDYSNAGGVEILTITVNFGPGDNPAAEPHWTMVLRAVE